MIHPPRWTYPLLCLCAMALVQGRVAAQTATLRGFVTDGATGQALELVNVALRDEQGNFAGTATQIDGLYQFRRVERGRYEVRASFIGYAPFSDTLLLRAGEFRTYNIVLQPSASELGELVIESQSEATAMAPIAGLQTVRAAEMNRIPVPDVSGDLASYLTTLPGVISIGDRGGQLFIRGGEPVQNRVMIDGIQVYQPFHLLGFYSAFPSDIISKADIYAGGFGAKFGGRLSSVIDIRSREGNTHSFAGSGSLSTFLGSLQLEGPIVPGRMSFLASVRKSLLDEIASQYVNDTLPLSFSDAFGKLNLDVSRTSKFSGTYLKTEDRGTLAEESVETEEDEIRWTNEIYGGRYLFLPRTFAVAVELRLSHTRMTNEIGPEGQSRQSSIQNTHAALDASFLGNRVNANAGFDFRVISMQSELGGLYQNLIFDDQRLTNWGNYLEMDIPVGDAIRLQPSIRAQFYRVRFKPYLESRFRMIWEKDRHRISAATGLHHQEVLGLNDRRDAANVFTAWTGIADEDNPDESVLGGRIQKAVHGILGYTFNGGRGFSGSIEGFYKELSNLLIEEWTAYPRFTTNLQPASGSSLGFDVRLGVQRPSFFAQANYALSATEYRAEQASIALWYGVETLKFRPPHDRRHQGNVMIGGEWKGIRVSARWSYGSGLPFNRAAGFDGFALIEDITDVGTLPTSRRVIYERPYRGRLPDYHRLDVSIEKAFEFGKAGVTVKGSVINVYNRANIFYLDVFTLRRVDQMPIVPTLGIEVSFF